MDQRVYSARTLHIVLGVRAVKGCERRVIRLKNPGGGLFEEAIFLLRTPAPEKGSDPREMVAEANRILLGYREGALKKKPRLRPAAFLLGALLGAAVAVGVLYLIGLTVN